MSVWNKFAAFALVGGLLSAPVYADGVPGQSVNRGPAPLKATAMTPPEPGCVLVEGNMWSCPVPAARFTHAPTTTRHAPVTRTTSTRTYTQPTTRTYTTSSRTHHAPVTTRTVTRSAPTVTRRSTSSRTVSAPVTRRVVSAPQQMKIDIAGFDGGVGAGLGGEPVYGGGTIFFGSDRRFSGVLSSSASVFTFQQRKRGGGKGRHNPRPRHNPCGGCK
ncbi:MAG: hypothetical protein AAGH90_00955 [Pseudomonadota bacterium]